jgi:hypothetical protein
MNYQAMATKRPFREYNRLPFESIRRSTKEAWGNLVLRPDGNRGIRKETTPYTSGKPC